MSDPLNRGAVVARGARFSVVWEVCGSDLVLLPIIQPRKRLAVDVTLDLADVVACGVPLAGAVVRPKRNPPVPAAGHQLVGILPGRTMCRVVQGLVRAVADAEHHDKWAHEERQRGHAADDRCVNLVG